MLAVLLVDGLFQVIKGPWSCNSGHVQPRNVKMSCCHARSLPKTTPCLPLMAPAPPNEHLPSHFTPQVSSRSLRLESFAVLPLHPWPMPSGLRCTRLLRVPDIPPLSIQAETQSETVQIKRTGQKTCQSFWV